MTRSFFVLALSVTLIGAFTPPRQAQEATPAPADHHPHVGEIDAVYHAFRAPDPIPSGWTIFQFTNEGRYLFVRGFSH